MNIVLATKSHLESGQGEMFSGRIWSVVSNNAARAHCRLRVGVKFQHLLPAG